MRLSNKSWLPRGFESRRTRRPSGLPETLPSADGAVHRRGYRDWVGFHRTVGPWSECSFCGPGSGRGHKGTWAGCIVSLTTPTRPLPTNLILMVLVSWGGGEAYSSTSASSPGHGTFGGGSSIPLHTTRWSSLIPSALDDHPWSPWSMEGPWSGPGRSMAFPIFPLPSLIRLLPCARFPRSNTAHLRFIPFRHVALCRGSGSRSSPHTHGGVLPPRRRHEPPRRGRGRFPDGRTSHRLSSGPLRFPLLGRIAPPYPEAFVLLDGG